MWKGGWLSLNNFRGKWSWNKVATQKKKIMKQLRHHLDACSIVESIFGCH